jgi:hypothetical protein
LHVANKIVIAGVCDFIPLLLTALYCTEAHVPSEVERLEYVTMTIIFIFLVEILANLFAFGLSFYTHHPLNLLDATIVIADFVFTVILGSKRGGPEDEGRSTESQAAGLIVFLRLWRVLKVVEESVEATAELSGERAERLRDELNFERVRMRSLEMQIEDYKAELEDLKRWKTAKLSEDDSIG